MCEVHMLMNKMGVTYTASPVHIIDQLVRCIYKCIDFIENYDKEN